MFAGKLRQYRLYIIDPLVRKISGGGEKNVNVNLT